jgi:hypothetical protein
MEASGQPHSPAALTQGEEPPVSTGEKAGWTLWRREKSCTAGNQTRAVQPVARRYIIITNICILWVLLLEEEGTMKHKGKRSWIHSILLEWEAEGEYFTLIAHFSDYV